MRLLIRLSAEKSFHTKKILAEDKKNIFAAFSIRSNGEYILGYKRIEDTEGYVGCVDGIRAISILWIMYGQRASAYDYFPIINRLQFREVNQFQLLLSHSAD